MPPRRRHEEWFAVVRNHVLYANQSGLVRPRAALPSLSAQNVNLVAAGKFIDAGNVELAETYLRRGLAQEPSNVIAHVRLAQILCDRGAVTEATAEINEALRLDPASVPARVVRVPLLISLGNSGAAVTVAKEVVSLRPTWPHGHGILGVRPLQSNSAAGRTRRSRGRPSPRPYGHGVAQRPSAGAVCPRTSR